MAMNDLMMSQPVGRSAQKAGAPEFKHGAKQSTKASGYDMTTEDFMKLIMAQFQNQDIMNPASTDQFLSQMVQMMTIQTMKNMNDISTISYAASLVGKEVTIGIMGKNGLEEIVGTVTGTGMMNGQQVIIVNGKEYALNQILAIGRLPEKPSEPELPTPGNPDPGMGVDPENPEKPVKPGEKPEGGTEPEGTEKPEGTGKPESGTEPEGTTAPEGEKGPDDGASGPTI